MKDYKEENNYGPRTTLWKCIVPIPIRLKSAPQKVNFVIAKATSKSYTLDCSCKCPCRFPHSYVQYHSLVFDKNHFN